MVVLKVIYDNSLDIPLLNFHLKFFIVEVKFLDLSFSEEIHLRIKIHERSLKKTFKKLKRSKNGMEIVCLLE